MHEVVFSATNLRREHGVRAMDVAKRLIDYGIHPPTMYFPLVVDEALMIEPTETESKETLDYFIEVMKQITVEGRTGPLTCSMTPLTTLQTPVWTRRAQPADPTYDGDQEPVDRSR